MALTAEQQNEINAIDEKLIAELQSLGENAAEARLFKIYGVNTIRYLFFRGEIQEQVLHGMVQKFINGVFYDRTVTLSYYLPGMGWAINNGPIQWVNHIAVVAGNPYIVSIQ